VNSHSKRYVASRGEFVIGVVVAKAGDTFRVDIGTR
jgi:exosome complex RNA-binding protein Rrp4